MLRTASSSSAGSVPAWRRSRLPEASQNATPNFASGAEVAREILEPGYRSSVLEALAARHRRTHQLLAAPFIGAALFALAPPLLGIPAIREAALRRYA